MKLLLKTRSKTAFSWLALHLVLRNYSMYILQGYCQFVLSDLYGNENSLRLLMYLFYKLLFIYFSYVWLALPFLLSPPNILYLKLLMECHSSPLQWLRLLLIIFHISFSFLPFLKCQVSPECTVDLLGHLKTMSVMTIRSPIFICIVNLSLLKNAVCLQIVVNFSLLFFLSLSADLHFRSNNYNSHWMMQRL